MRATVPGTTHSTTLHRDECAILERLGRSSSVKKLKSGRIANTKTSRRELQLRPHVMVGKIESIIAGWLHIGGGKRQLTIFTTAAVTIDALRDEFANTLTDLNVPVKVCDDSKEQKQEEMMNHDDNGHLPPDDLWSACELIAERVTYFKTLQAEKEKLQEKLNTLRIEQEETKAHTLSELIQVLDIAPGVR